MESNFSLEYAQAKAAVEARLSQFFPGEGLEEAMRYSLLAGGKRIRPVLTVKFCQAAGGVPSDALDFGCALEMLHTYSLIHDDLPCMDDDDLRRGKPTCHKVYGECVAVLAGDALQAAAFQTVLTASGFEGTSALRQAAVILAEAAGAQGMCGGQFYDTVQDGNTRGTEELALIHDKKTGALLRAACMMGVAAAEKNGKADASHMEAAREYASRLGLAFQIRDDILDAVSTVQELGKPIGSDEANHKTTYVTLLGLAECERRVAELTAQAKAALDRVSWPGGAGFLRWLADDLAGRNH